MTVTWAYHSLTEKNINHKINSEKSSIEQLRVIVNRKKTIHKQQYTDIWQWL